MKKIILSAVCFLSSMNSFAHPVIHKDGVVIDSENNMEMSEYHGAYSLTNSASLGGHYIKEGLVELQFLQGSLLLHRWLNEASQANIYTTFAVGAERLKKSWTAAQLAEIETDWESRDYYLMLKQRYIERYSNADDLNKANLWHTRAKVGLAPFKSDANDLGVWFMMQFDKHNENYWTTTNLMRFYYKSALWEVGANLNGSYQLNFMIHL